MTIANDHHIGDEPVAGRFVKVNGINIHYLAHKADKPTMILLHGLTANSRAFDGLLKSGLKDRFNILIPDLRGRGLSDHPAFCYTMNEHAEDIIGLMNHYGIKEAIFVGHSFGGFLSFFLAANYKTRVSRVVALDAAIEMNPRAPEMLAFTILRLDKVFGSFEQYMGLIKKAPFTTFWDESMLSYYRADVKDLPSGEVTPRSNLVNILEAAKNLSNEPWQVYVNNILQPVLLLNAVENYNLNEPLLPDFKAKETVERLDNGRYQAVGGNHQTMLYGEPAKEVVSAILDFTT